MIQQMLAIWSLVPLPFLFFFFFFAVASAFSKSSLNIWKFTIYVLLKPGLENFEHYFGSVWDECNCVVVWTYFALPFFGIQMKTDLFQSCGHCWVYQECNTLPTSHFRIWNSSAEIPSPPLVFFVVKLIKAHLTSDSRMFVLRWLTTSSLLSGSLRTFLYSSVFSCQLFLISSASFRSLPNKGPK